MLERVQQRLFHLGRLVDRLEHSGLIVALNARGRGRIGRDERDVAGAENRCEHDVQSTVRHTTPIDVARGESRSHNDDGEHGQHAYNLATGPGWLEQATTGAARQATVAATTLATNENV